MSYIRSARNIILINAGIVWERKKEKKIGRKGREREDEEEEGR